jgi:hypothetical protein
MRNLKEFSWNEAFNDNNGKTNIRYISGFMIVVTACLMFLYSGIVKYNDGLMAAGAFVLTGGTMLTAGRFTKDQPLRLGEETNKTE